MKSCHKQTLYILSSFLAGFSLMTVELVSTRIVAPIIGSSVYTWTSVIGITLVGISLGSFIGGKIADKYKGWESIALSFLSSSVLVSLIPILSKNTDFLTNSYNSIEKLNVLLALYLFLLPSLAMGLIQPIILKEYTDDLSEIGKKYGILSAMWSIGSVLGVFLTGFYFISNIGSNETIWLISIILFLTGLIFSLKNRTVLLIFLVVILLMSFIFFELLKGNAKKTTVIFHKETNYYDARVANVNMPFVGKSKILFLDFGSHSIEMNKVNPYFYTEIYPVFSNLKKDIKSIVTIGAGAYTLPKHFKDYYKNADVSVIETDPEMVNIGNDYFNLKNYKIKTVIGDARIIIKKDPKKYDIIFGDAYNSFISVPWYLLTKEWNMQIKERLNANGIYAINFIGSLNGEFTSSVINTLKTSFPNVYIFSFGVDNQQTENIVVLGINGNLPITEKELYNKLLSGKNNFLADRLVTKEFQVNPSAKIFTDNFSPTEKLMEPIIQKAFPKNISFIKDINYSI